jgi:beta-lactam-binding protein with PASTA domain/predicted Ser/Thr protein kinase
VAELTTGKIIDGRYRVLSRIGTGGMADVYLAEDEQLGRKVAVKLLHQRFAEDPGFVERFRREARAAAGLQHPNVVSVYDRGAYDDTYYIAMEYLPGRSLKQLIRQEAPLDPVRAIDIAVQVLKAARFAHRRGVIHRDLKPHNVIVDETDHAKVTDFGIARAGASDMTETGSIMGTAQYLSPEQAQGLQVAATSDLYSVGVVLYEMLTGQVPFDAESAVTIALRHVSEAPRPLRELNPAVPPELEQTVLWAMNKNPADRPRDAEQLIEVLGRIRESIVSGGGQRTASMPVLAAAGPGAAAAAVPVPAAAPPGEAVSADGTAPWEAGLPPAGNGGDPEARRRRRRWPWILALALVALIAAGAAAAILLTRGTAERSIPKVVGEQLDVAQAKLQSAGFVASVTYETNSARRNEVIGQSPLAGAREPRGFKVTLYVSGGPGNVTIPSVVGDTRDHAIKLLERAGLQVGSVQPAASATVPSGRAVGTNPASGRPVGIGTTVTLYVSSGPPKVQVPAVVGQPQATATLALRHAQFVVNVVKQNSSSVPAGEVISQNPPGNASALRGSIVTISVSAGPQKVAVPSTVGETEAAARAQLRAAGFSVAVQHRTVTTRSQSRRVISQTPDSGRLPSGARVTIVVGRYHAPPTQTGATGTTTTPAGTTTTGSAPPRTTPSKPPRGILGL